VVAEHVEDPPGRQRRHNSHAAKPNAGEASRVKFGGYGPECDLITPLQITPAGVVPHGPARRLVQPDGLEIPRTARAFCRGPNLSLLPRDSTAWYRLGLDDIFP
jgi:hypothetical protein